MGDLVASIPHPRLRGAEIAAVLGRRALPVPVLWPRMTRTPHRWGSRPRAPRCGDSPAERGRDE